MSFDQNKLVKKLAGRRTTSSRPQEPAVKCPRCHSLNTKFCYYNNYSLRQPRYFCKTCRRYWTNGGALRNVPIGGGCRKDKTMSRFSPRLFGSSQDSGGSSGVGGLKFFHGISPAMDFQLGGINFPRLHSSPNTGLFNQFSSFGDTSNTCGAISSRSCFSLGPITGTTSPPLMEFTSLPYSSARKQAEDNGVPLQEMGSLSIHSSFPSSIESLSSVNQDLHWKLQQERLGMLPSIEPLAHHKSQSIMLHDISKQESGGIGSPRKGGACRNLSTEWFFDNAYGTVAQNSETSGRNVNQNASNWSGIQTWSVDLVHYPDSLP